MAVMHDAERVKKFYEKRASSGARAVSMPGEIIETLHEKIDAKKE